MDRPGENYAKRNKPVRERKITYDLTDMWNLMNNTKKCKKKKKENDVLLFYISVVRGVLFDKVKIK